MNNCCLYIGASNDLEPTLKLQFIKEWIYVDTFPDTEGESREILYIPQDINPDDENKYKTDIDFRRNHFFDISLKKHFSDSGFEFVKENADDKFMVFLRKKDNVTLNYFYNNIYPKTTNLVLEDKLLQKTDSIYIQGYVPLIDIMALPKINTLFLGDDVRLLPDDLEDNNIINFLYRNYVEGLKYVLVDRIFKTVEDLFYSKNLLDAHHKSLTTDEHVKYVDYLRREEMNEYLKEPKHFIRALKMETTKTTALPETDWGKSSKRKSKKSKKRKSKKRKSKKRKKSRK